MKQLFLTIFILLCFKFISAQVYFIHEKVNIVYDFRISGITNPAEAKIITDDLRSFFNAYPTFNDSTDHFHFSSDVIKEQSALATLLSNIGHTLLSFSRQEPIIAEEVPDTSRE